MKKILSVLLFILAVVYVVGRIAVSTSRYTGTSTAGPKYSESKYDTPVTGNKYYWTNNCEGDTTTYEILFLGDGTGRVGANTDLCADEQKTTFKYSVNKKNELFLTLSTTDRCLLFSCGIVTIEGKSFIRLAIDSDQMKSSSQLRKVSGY